MNNISNKNIATVNVTSKHWKQTTLPATYKKLIQIQQLSLSSSYNTWNHENHIQKRRMHAPCPIDVLVLDLGCYSLSECACDHIRNNY